MQYSRHLYDTVNLLCSLRWLRLMFAENFQSDFQLILFLALYHIQARVDAHIISTLTNQIPWLGAGLCKYASECVCVCVCVCVFASSPGPTQLFGGGG